jgi:glycosyltransferase involved in cell wall biosynthesis
VRVSIVFAVLDSHEVVRRQMLHFAKMPLPIDVEIILVDDGSDPPLIPPKIRPERLRIYATGNKDEWTQPAARNFGARQANGDYLLLTDIDHILTRELIEAVRTCRFDVLRFTRELGVLDEHGDFTQDADVLLSYGVLPERIAGGRRRIRPHSNSWAIKRDLFWQIGGMPAKKRRYPNREEVPVKQRLKKLAAAGEITICDTDSRPTIFMFPVGRYCGDDDFNPFGLFHSLSRNRS